MTENARENIVSLNPHLIGDEAQMIVDITRGEIEGLENNAEKTARTKNAIMEALDLKFAGPIKGHKELGFDLETNAFTLFNTKGGRALGVSRLSIEALLERQSEASTLSELNLNMVKIELLVSAITDEKIKNPQLIQVVNQEAVKVMASIKTPPDSPKGTPLKADNDNYLYADLKPEKKRA